MAVILALLAVGCAEPGEARGELTDALGGAAPVGVGVVAVATEEAPEACARLTAPVEDGEFVLTGLCPGTRYRIEPDHAEWWAPEAPEVDGGAASTGLTVPAFHVPGEDGVAILTGGALTRLTSQAALDTITPLDGAASLRIPTSLPSTPPAVGDGWLVLAGAGVIDAVVLHALAPTPRLTVGPPEAPRTLDPWFALGAAAEPAHPRDLAAGGRRVRLLPKDALPAGDYVLAERGGSRGILVRFGASP